MSYDIKWHDQFGGWGGFPAGIEQVPGNRVVAAGNHARHCYLSYQANHPNVRVDCADLTQISPASWPRADALTSSPECTWHTPAQGKERDQGDWDDTLFAVGRPNQAAIRSRATMYCIPAFAEYHRYKIIIMENVPEVFWWGPKHNKGAAFQAWLAQNRAWGYLFRLVYMNSAHMGAHGPAAHTSRDRLWGVLYHESVGRTPNFDKWTRPLVRCERHGVVQAIQAWHTTVNSSPSRPWGKHGSQYTWRCPSTSCAAIKLVPLAVRPAAEIIDTSVPGTVIGDLKTRWRSQLTRDKVASGHLAYAGESFIAELRGGGSTHRSVRDPLSTITAGGNHHLWVHGDSPQVEGRFARMVGIEERAAAMGFPSRYQAITTAEKKSDADKQRISMIGMAVAPPSARDLGAMATEFLTGEDIEPLGYRALLAA